MGESLDGVVSSTIYVTFNLISGLVFRMIMTGAYLLYDLR